VNSSLIADTTLAARLFDTLADSSRDEPGITRDAYGAGEQRAHDCVAAEGKRLGLSCETDAAGNLYMRLAGSKPDLAPWIVGSHLDTVPHGGNFDGAAGILAGLAAVSAMQRAGVVPRRPVVVMAIRAEKSTWFPASYIGSRAAFGRLPASVLDLPRSDTGRSLAQHMAESGFDPEAVRACSAYLDPGAIHGYIEVHIEQGPVLDEAEIPVGLVTGIAGSFRYRNAFCRGRYGHSGAVPRRHRQDAVMGVADLAMRLDRLWAGLDEAGQTATITFGEVETDARLHAFSKVPGEVRFCLDVRSRSERLLCTIDSAVLTRAAQVESERGVRFDFGERTDSVSAPMDERLHRSLAQLAERLGIPTLEMQSGAGHAATFASAGVPSALIFIRNQNGSHNPDEAIHMADFASAATLLVG
jgi:beta-ureidopropionase / N-carbamoyl-L-amino-acid hydrolase